MMLAKGFDKKKLTFPCLVSEKLDGVAAMFEKRRGTVECISRQNKPITSVQHICEALEKVMQDGDKVFCELTVPTYAFKDAGGIIRRKETDIRIRANVYDYVPLFADTWTFKARLEAAKELNTFFVEVIPHILVENEEGFDEALRIIKNQTYELAFEGYMVRTLSDSYYKIGRSWGMMKLKGKPTVDLRIIRIEEAIDKHGQPKGMAGRINCEYNGMVIGVGPGKSDHELRKYMWENRDSFVGKIIEVEYMEDDSYEALRQPTFQRLRDDKDEPSYE